MACDQVIRGSPALEEAKSVKPMSKTKLSPLHQIVARDPCAKEWLDRVVVDSQTPCDRMEMPMPGGDESARGSWTRYRMLDEPVTGCRPAGGRERPRVYRQRQIDERSIIGS